MTHVADSDQKRDVDESIAEARRHWAVVSIGIRESDLKGRIGTHESDCERVSEGDRKVSHLRKSRLKFWGDGFTG